MNFRPGSLILKAFKALAYSAVGALVVLVIGLIVYMNSRASLSVWHLADLDEEFTVDSKVETFGDYLALEDRLFRQLDELVYAKIAPEQRHAINRYNRGSLTDPEGLSHNWNRSFILPKENPGAAVLLLHGMSDSPYSLRNLGERLNAAGAYVLGLRVPGHGTAPSGLVEVTWQDMAAAVRLAMRHLAQHSNGQPLYVVGYSNGGALAVHYTLSTLEDEALPKVDRVVLLSPEIGVTPAAAFAVWQARLGHLLGLEKLAWNDILPEYEAFKYGSFAVNAGDVVYRITSEIQKRLTALGGEEKLKDMPSILAFTSVIDATVSTPALVSGLFDRLPAGGHELVLFDVNRITELKPLMKWDPVKVVQALQADPDKTYTLSLVTNENAFSRKVVVRSKRPGKKKLTDSSTGLSWPDDIYSLAHVALPFPADDPLYGGHPPQKSQGLHLGELALRGERGALQISASSMLRLRWNPFYPYVEERVLNFLDLDSTSPVP
ncbi:MAG: alpha/beta fold hydrolase [Gammaproteobacteria bacterium]|nr:alpha/beta fold hydrolase [Gammaproteobacteria bacterium]